MTSLAWALFVSITISSLWESGSTARHEVTWGQQHFRRGEVKESSKELCKTGPRMLEIQLEAIDENEDIRDAILSLLTMFRDNGEKLERHEYRERQLGEQLKKALSGLDKRYRSQDQNIDKIGSLMLKLEERLKNFETMMSQKDERERIQLQKSQNAIEGVQKILFNITKDLEDSSKGSTATYTIQDSDKEHIEALGDSLKADLRNISSLIKDVQTKVLTDKSSEESNSIELNKEIKKSILETERIMQKMMEDSSESKAEISNWKTELSNLLGKEKKELEELLQINMRTAKEIKELPTKLDLLEMSNVTQENLQEMREQLMSVNDQSITKISLKIDEAIAGVNNGQEDIIKNMADIQSLGENLYSDISKSYEQLLKEIKGLSKVEQVMIQTADNVLDTKRRIEYGVHQILLEVGDLIKLQAKSLNSTLNQRFDDVETSILDNQTGAMTNLSSKIETEISQVWRQIGTMHHELTASANTLDKLQQQTDTYVNDTVKVMGSMGGKVGEITARMAEVDENLNYLIGRLSLVTSEFNQIKSGLASALDNIRNSFLDIQNGIKDVGPGPKPIPEEEENNLPSTNP